MVAVIPPCAEFDILFAAVMHRDTLTPAAGWTLVSTVTSNFPDNPFHQSMSVYSLVATSGSGGSNTTWAQATSQRMGVQILAFRPSPDTGVPLIIDRQTSSLDGSLLTTFPNPVATATRDGQMGVVFSNYPLADNSNPSVMTLTMTGSTQTTPTSTVGNRMCGGYVKMVAGGTTAGSIYSAFGGSGGQQGGWAGVAFVLGTPTIPSLVEDTDEFYPPEFSTNSILPNLEEDPEELFYPPVVTQ